MVVKRPEGHKIIDTAISAAISEDVGEALINFSSHGLVTGVYVYITSDIDEYNGFWYVTRINANAFKISEYSGAGFVEFFQNADIDYYQTQSHVWSSIFLPIVYKISNDKWPTNTFNAENTIYLNEDDNGYTYLTLLTPLAGLTGPLQYIKISGASDSANGIWQVVEVIIGSQFVISLPSENAGNLTGATIQYYYNSYQTKVKIYGGLNPTHPWADKKPYELLGELSLTPDENNITTFSISDYLKNKIQVKNNTLLYSLPLNLDAFTGFYIETAESFDSSDNNYTLITDESEFISDDFEGYAIAGKLPFQNTYSGDYSDYVATDSNPALWLSTLTRLLALADKYFDLSFINPVQVDFQVILKKYLSTDYYITETVDYQTQGIGVYRIPITPDSQYIKYCVQALTPGAAAVPRPLLPNVLTWQNAGLAGPWTLGPPGAWNTSVNGNSGITDYLIGAFAAETGVMYTFTINTSLINTGGASPIVTVRSALLDGALNVIVFDDVVYTTYASSRLHSFSLTPSTDATWFGIMVINDTPLDSKTIEFNNAAADSGGGSPAVDALILTDEICFDVIDDCDVPGGFTPDDIRLLEDGDYRLLE